MFNLAGFSSIDESCIEVRVGLKLLIVEALATGLIKAPSSILIEGFSMLRRFSTDAAKLNWIDVYIAVDKRIVADLPGSILPCRRIYLEDPCIEDLLYWIGRLDFDKVYMIAPETNGFLPAILRRIVDEYGSSIIVNGSIDRLNDIIDKLNLYHRLSEIDVKTPRSIDIGEATLEDLDRLGYPLIVKPRLEAGCSGLRMVGDRREAEELLRDHDGCWIFQEYVKGLASSFSLVSDGCSLKLLSVNRQFVTLSHTGSSYLGGYVPLISPRIRVDELIDKLEALLYGLKGYIGIDTVISGDEVYVIEVNPRLTVSYIGLSRSYKGNPAEAILEAALHGKLQEMDLFKGFSVFLKVKKAASSIDMYVDDRVEASIGGYSLISGFGYSLRDAWMDLIDVRGKLS
ncbi:MAG: ATP-grasp domain-containing protein [Candidatus Bathyarchaeia archaeon]